jgi:hypothetical protein
LIQDPSDDESDEEPPYVIIPNNALNPMTATVLIQDPSSDRSDDEESDNDEMDEQSKNKNKKRKFLVSSLPTFYR